MTVEQALAQNLFEQNQLFGLTARVERDNMKLTEYTSRLLPPTVLMASCRSEDPLRNYSSSLLSTLLVVSVVFPLAGCIAHAPGSGGGGGQQIQVAVTSSLAAPYSLGIVDALNAPSKVQYTASVTGTSNQAVTWALAAYSGASVVCTATGSGLGTMTITGTNTMTYTAPPGPLPISPCGVAVTATSNEDNVTTGQALVNVHVIVSIAPSPASIGQRANFQFSGSVVGADPTTGQGIQWSAQNGGAFDNPVYNNGLYVAPPLTSGETPLSVTIQATSTFDSTQTTSVPITVVKVDPLGTIAQSTAASALITCPAFTAGATGASCYQLTVSCDAVADYYAYLKVNAPTGSALGTVILGTGTGGTSLYDNDTSFTANGFNGGDFVVEGLLNLANANQGYTTVQVSFGDPFNPQPAQPNGWLQGPGGVRRLACRYATVADWVHKNIHNSSTTAPYCATGNSAGSGAIAYAVSEYGLAPEFTMLEETSGPVMTLLNQGCNVCGGQDTGSDPCTQTQGVDMCFTAAGGTGSTAAIIDTAYQVAGQSTPTLCSDAVNAISAPDSQFTRFLSDSIEDDPSISPPLPIPNPPTNINILFGDDDPSNAVPQGYAWRGAVGAAPGGNVPFMCVQSTHAIPSTSAGATQILGDIRGTNLATTGVIGCVPPTTAAAKAAK